MAYFHHYILAFNSPVTENVVINLYRKDVAAPPTPIKLKCLTCSKSYLNGAGEGNDTIVGSELTFSFWLPAGSIPDFKDFIVSFHDEWKVEMVSDGQTEFIGFITPGEGESSLRDKPYELELSATDNLGLIKSEALRKQDGTSFTGENTLITYVLACLFRTNLNLNVLLYCNIYESSMPDRNTDPNSDAFNQAKQDYRTYQKDPITFMDCYTVLQNLLGNGFQLTQWNGKWVIMRNGEMQLNVGPQTWYTEYDYQGNIIDAALDTTDIALVGKEEVLHPKNANQRISAAFAVKSAKSTFDYKIWPEIPLNNKFERGTEFDSGVAIDDSDYDNDGDTSEVIGTYKSFTIDNMEQGVVDLFDLPHPAMVPATEKFYRRSIFNQFGIEIQREVIAETKDLDINHDFWLRTEGVPVYTGDKIRIGLSKRFSNDFSSSSATVFTIPVVVYIVSGGNAYYLDNNISGSQSGTGRWRLAVNLAGQMILDFAPHQDTKKYGSLSVESLQIPFDGILYIAFKGDGPSSNTGSLQYMNDFSFEYFPSVAGSLKTVKGDYWKTQQDPDYKDTYDDPHYTSDSPKKVIVGTLLRNNGDLTTRSWARLNEGPGQMDYKEILNIGRYNQARRRMWRVKGTFGGTAYYAGLTGIRLPLSLHRHYAFTFPSLAGVYFQLVPPVTIDYRNGEITATFREALDLAESDGMQTGTLHEFKYVFD